MRENEDYLRFEHEQAIATSSNLTSKHPEIELAQGSVWYSSVEPQTASVGGPSQPAFSENNLPPN